MKTPTHAIAVVLPGYGDYPGSTMLHDWGTEEEMLDKLTDPENPRWKNCTGTLLDPDRAGYQIIEITQADVDAELAKREEEMRHQRAHSWAM